MSPTEGLIDQRPKRRVDLRIGGRFDLDAGERIVRLRAARAAGFHRAEAADDMVQSIFTEMMEQVEEEPYAQVRLDDVDLTPVTYKFVMPLTPTVNLNEYREIRKEIEEVEITDEAVEEQGGEYRDA